MKHKDTFRFLLKNLHDELKKEKPSKLNIGLLVASLEREYNLALNTYDADPDVDDLSFSLQSNLDEKLASLEDKINQPTPLSLLQEKVKQAKRTIYELFPDEPYQFPEVCVRSNGVIDLTFNLLIHDVVDTDEKRKEVISHVANKIPEAYFDKSSSVYSDGKTIIDSISFFIFESNELFNIHMGES